MSGDRARRTARGGEDLSPVGPAVWAASTLDQSLAAITHAARDAISWVDHVSVCVTDPSGMTDVFSATGPLAAQADAVQRDLQEGPSVETAAGTAIVHSDDVGSDSRWPAYRTRAVELGVRAQTAVRLVAGDDMVGSLNLYSISAVPGLAERSTAAAHMFAAQAAAAIAFASRVESLRAAVVNRQDISQAIGIVMARFGLDESRAQEYLVRASQTSQVKLRVIAQELIGDANRRTA